MANGTHSGAGDTSSHTQEERRRRCKRKHGDKRVHGLSAISDWERAGRGEKAGLPTGAPGSFLIQPPRRRPQSGRRRP